MYKYVIKRILLTIPVLLGAVFLVFTIMYLTPGDPQHADPWHYRQAARHRRAEPQAWRRPPVL